MLFGLLAVPWGRQPYYCQVLSTSSSLAEPASLLSGLLQVLACLKAKVFSASDAILPYFPGSNQLLCSLLQLSQKLCERGGKAPFNPVLQIRKLRLREGKYNVSEGTELINGDSGEPIPMSSSLPLSLNTLPAGWQGLSPTCLLVFFFTLLSFYTRASNKDTIPGVTPTLPALAPRPETLAPTWLEGHKSKCPLG